MTEQQAATIIAQNNVIIALLHAQIIAGGNAPALLVANKQMEIAKKLA